MEQAGTLMGGGRGGGRNPPHTQQSPVAGGIREFFSSKRRLFIVLVQYFLHALNYYLLQSFSSLAKALEKRESFIFKPIETADRALVKKTQWTNIYFQGFSLFSLKGFKILERNAIYYSKVKYTYTISLDSRVGFKWERGNREKERFRKASNRNVKGT